MAYAEYTGTEDFDSIPQYWANDLFRDYKTDGLEHNGCELCWGPNSPEAIASLEIEELEKRKKKKSQRVNRTAAVAMATAAVAPELCGLFIATDCLFDSGDSF